VFAPEHRLAPLREPALLGERHEQLERFVGDPVLRVVEVEPGGLGRQPGAAAGVGGEQIAQVLRRDLSMVRLKRLPRTGLAQLAHVCGAVATPARLRKMSWICSSVLPFVSGTMRRQKKKVTTQIPA
jgi:hypothetical protein